MSANKFENDAVTIFYLYGNVGIVIISRSALVTATPNTMWG